MQGRIREEDIALVRERSRIEDVVSTQVTLRNAGGGSMKGLCPFHEEKTPSFNVNPARGFFHCFGCGEGGDVITFLMKTEGLGFSEAVERLAERFGVTLRREEDPSGRPDRPRGPSRMRLVAANAAAAEYYVEQLATPAAETARTFLLERNFDREVAADYGLGFAPRDGESLLRHLRGRGFSQEELSAAGLVGNSGRGAYDRFRGRLLWPIRDAAGDVLGFGARRIFDDDRIDAKYLNTSETSLYKKSNVLYGIDRARKEIGRTSQAVIVEGYTDVMACHLSGVTTAVATCGTAFGDDHARLLRRFLHDHDEFRGEVIFTFDGDAAGQKAALKAFEGDQNFASQTYVTIADDGQDPCDLRLSAGEEAVRELVAKRVPLYRFVLQSVVRGYDLDRADGRVDAVRAGAKLVASVRDKAKVDAFSRELAQLVGVEVEEARTAVHRASSAGGSGRSAPESAPPPRRTGPDLRDPRFALERETLKLVIQHPIVIGRTTAQITVDDFTHPTYQAVWRLVEEAGGFLAGASDPSWAMTIRDAATEPEISSVVSALATEPVLLGREPDLDYVTHHVVRLLELTVMRRIADTKSRLQRTNPVTQQADYNKMFGRLAALEQHRRTLRDRLVGMS